MENYQFQSFNHTTSNNFTLGNFQLPQTQFNFNPNLNVPNLNINNHQSSSQHFSLLNNSLNLTSHSNSNEFQANRYSFFSPPQLEIKPLNPVGSVLDLTIDSSVALSGDKIPVLEKGVFLLNTIKAGKELSDNIQKDLEKGTPKDEALVCQTVKTLTDNGLSTISTGLITAGIPAYLTAAVANPPLALTIPAVGTLLPHAYSNAVTVSHIAGDAAEQICHDAFSTARQLSNRSK